MASNTWIPGVFLRIALPFSLAASIVFRPSGLSFIYLILYLYLPFVPLPNARTLKGHTGRFLQVSLTLAFLTVISQIIFQIVLLSFQPYGLFLTECSLTEKILRHLGYIRLNALNWLQILRWLGPDVVALIGILVTYLVISNLINDCDPIPIRERHKKSKGSRILEQLGPYVVLSALCISSSLEPSILNGIYYLIFLLGATWWGLCQNIRNKFFTWVYTLSAIFVVVHVLSIFFYQLQWSQEILQADSLLARLLGLVPMFLTSCETDPRDTSFNFSLTWVSYVNPLSLLILYHLLVYEIKTLRKPSENGRGESLPYHHTHPPRSRLGSLVEYQQPRRLSNTRLSRRQTVRWQGKSATNSSRRARTGGVGKSIINSISNLVFATPASARFSRRQIPDPRLNETTPLMTFSAMSPTRRRYSSGRRVSSAGGDGIPIAVTSLARGLSVTSRDSVAQSMNDTDYDNYGLLVAGLFTLFDLFTKSSYVATNIIMMAWSITYHSWLTFVLLLWACVLWMFPNQRKAMLMSSPGLVLYAELLLIAQYVYSLNLNNTELPQTVDGINLAEIGLVKSNYLALLPILVKSLYTGMFWITLRQYVMDKKEVTIENAAEESLRITVTASAAPGIHITEPGKDTTHPSYMLKLGSFVKQIMTKFWIWVVAIMLFVIGLGGEKVVLYRIVYMALFLIFILTFQLSYGLWRKMMYSFWLTVIVYSMFVLVMIYTYQFEDIPYYLSNYTHIPKQLQIDIGLETYDTGSLFVRLLTPTFFVIITVVQLHYFHRDFLKLSDMEGVRESRKQLSPVELVEDEPPPALIDHFDLTNLLKNLSYYGGKLFRTLMNFYSVASEIGWRFLEIHIMKIVLFSCFLLSVYDSCALHFILFVLVICGISVTSMSVQKLITHIISICISALFLAKMIYQIDYIRHEDWNTNCTILNETVTKNDAEWVGLSKSSQLANLLRGYIGMILVLTIQAVVHIRQMYQRYMSSSVEPVLGILFNGITRRDADKNLINCVKFMFNYGFYKFGVEITLVTMVIVIGTRLDLFSVLYCFWLIPMFLMTRAKLARVWLPFILFIAVVLPIQYLSCVGLPLFLCPEYPWETWPYFKEKEMKEWLFLPDVNNPPKAPRLIPDFFLLLFACQQQLVFWIEKNTSPDFPGGTNEEIVETYIPPTENPCPDFLSARSKTWLDIIKKWIFSSFYWITLAIIFLTGTNRVNLFALGYLIGSFIFLWEGNEFYLRTRRSIIKRWNYLISFTVFVLFSKAILQLVGCVFYMKLNCWLIQLFGIACLKFGPDSTTSTQSDCRAPQGEAGLMWDGITFGFLLFQRKIFNSYYFYHIRSETEAQAQLASRGAELIGELMQKQIKQQEEVEKDVLEKIKMKMDRIKATQSKGRPKEIQNHFDVSSMDSQISLEEVQVTEPEASPLAPLAVPVSTAITSGSGPTPTPSSAAMTISVDGFFEPPYGRERDSLLQPPLLPLSPSDESFPVFSPPPYDRNKTTGVQTSPPYRYPHSPSLSHHTSIRSGDYYMFEEYEDEDLEMIDSITEEDDEDTDEGKPAGVTISELMASALKTGDVETAADMARLARRGSDVRDREGSLITDSGEEGVQRRKSKRRLSRKSFSIRSRMSGRYRGRESDAGVLDESAPLAVSDGEGEWTISGDPGGGGDPGAGGDGQQPSTSQDAAARPVEPIPEHPGPTIMRRIFGYLRFGWAFLESVMISLTNYLNKFSKDYRHVSKCLALEKLQLKEREITHPPVFAIHTGLSTELLDPKVQHDSIELGIEIEKVYDKQLSIESGASGDAIGSKDDLQTVVEKPSPGKLSEESLEKMSSSEESEAEYPPIVHLVIAIWYVIISHSDLVCYFVVFLNQMKSASILSLPLPLMVLLWGSLSVPRPTKTFWVTMIAYTEAIVVVKYLFQFDFFPWNDPTLTTKKDPFSPPRILGIEKHGKYAAYDVTLLMVIFFHRFMLKSLGLWKNKADSNENSIYIEEEKEYDSSYEEEGDGDKEDSALSASDTSHACAPNWDQWKPGLTYGPKVLKLCIIQYTSSIKLFFFQILNLEYKVKVDVYSYMFICDFFNFLVIIFGFASFGSQQGDVSSYIEENKVPVPFLVMVILQFALIVVDRALYLRKYILGKFFYQMFLVTFVHVAMFFILPAVTERDFNANLPPQMWYMVKCIYLLFSAYQIRSGYPTRILGNFLCKKYNYVNMFLFKGFMAVPFLFELRALMDWIWTDTSMTLSDWLKLEDIFAHVFQLKCQRRVEKEYPQERGMPKARWSKYLIGGSSLFIIILIIWFPLVLFALGNTVGLPNKPKEMSIELSIGSYQPIFTMSAQNSSLRNFTLKDFDNLIDIYRGDKTPLYFLNNYESDDIMLAQFNGNSDSVWGISPPSKSKLIDELKSSNPISIRFSWTVQRETSTASSPGLIKEKLEVYLDPKDKTRFILVDMINGSTNDTVRIKHIFPKFLKVTNTGKAQVATNLEKQDKTDFLYRDLELTLKTSGTSGNTQEWWDVKEACYNYERADPLPMDDHCKKDEQLNMYTFNEKSFPPTLSFISGGGIIGLYTTLVLVASKFVRSFFAGISFLIMFDDMPNVDRIFQLCLDIYLVRESNELALEEDLFAKLIFLYRSPETLIKWTRPKTTPPALTDGTNPDDPTIKP